MVYGSGSDVDGSNSDIGGRVGGRESCSKRVEPVLVSLSNLYSELNTILVEASSTLFVYLILFTDYLMTDYCLNQIVNYFVLRRILYTK